MLTNPIVAPGAQIVLSASTWLTLLVGTGVALMVAALVERRQLAAAFAGFSLAAIIAVTVVPLGGWSALGFETGALRSIVTNLHPHHSALTGWLRNSDGPANVLLFVPAGLFFAWWSGRPLLAAIGLTALSVAIECWQATLTTRIGSFDDVVANGLGAVIGAAVAGTALLVHRATIGRRPSSLSGGPTQRATMPF